MKLIAEPWDLGAGGYQVGNFPVLWTEWNGKYRDAVRAFWKGDGGGVVGVRDAPAGSNDLYEHSGRRPYASINFITATTASRCRIWSATTRSTTKPTARTTATARTTT